MKAAILYKNNERLPISRVVPTACNHPARGETQVGQISPFLRAAPAGLCSRMRRVGGPGILARDLAVGPRMRQGETVPKARYISAKLKGHRGLVDVAVGYRRLVGRDMQ